jgi:response regulator RpfG family c-di-GMP phosphodiesterase
MPDGQDNTKTTEHSRLKKLESANRLLKNLFDTGIIDQETREKNKKIVKDIKDKISISKLNEQFEHLQKESPEEYIRCIITGYVALNILENFTWAKPEMKEKLLTASLLCDITLGPRNFSNIYTLFNEPFKLTKNSLQHPNNVCKLIQENNFEGDEVLDIIRQHHERPDSTGFPNKIPAKEFTKLSTIFNVATYFTYELVCRNFAEDAKDLEIIDAQGEILENLKKTYKEGVFKESVASLFDIFSCALF